MLLDELADSCRRRPDHPYIWHEGREVTFAEFDRSSNAAAHALLSLGVAKGDRVTLALGNSVEWLLCAFGALKAGAVLNPVNPALGDSELAWVIGHAEPRVILTDPSGAAAFLAPSVRRGNRAVVATFGGTTGTEPFRPLLESSPTIPPPVSIEDQDGSTLLYTSGTTGRPKGVLFTHGRTGRSTRFLIQGLGLTGDDTILFVGPLFHGNAWSGALCAAQVGCTVAFPSLFHASRFWALVEECGATALFTLGTVLAILLTQEAVAAERVHRVRVILGLGSAPIRDRVRERFGVRDVVECFGSTDAGVVTVEPLGVPARPGSSGPPLPGVSVRIADDEGREVPVRQVGEITIRSPHRMEAYFRDPEQTRAALRDDWFLTGDLGWVDEDGWLYFVDRKRDVIRRGGENISSVLVEKVLREHPKVAEVAVIGVPDPVLGQEVKAYVVPRDTVAVEELRAFAAARLARFQVPRLWELRELLPKTPTQRVEKYKLRAESGDRGAPRLG